MDLVTLLALLTLLSNISLVVFLFVWLNRKYLKKSKLWNNFINFIILKHYLLAFIVALTATLGSLYLSDIRGFTPCKLCWYQRVFMYPLVIILGVSLVKKIKSEVFVIALSLIGAVIALYHYLLQINPAPFAPCTTVGFSVSCSERFTTSYGYITIPWMALTAFVLILIAMLLPKKIK